MIAGIAAIGAFIAAALMAILVALGVVHHAPHPQDRLTPQRGHGRARPDGRARPASGPIDGRRRSGPAAHGSSGRRSAPIGHQPRRSPSAPCQLPGRESGTARRRVGDDEAYR